MLSKIGKFLKNNPYFVIALFIIGLVSIFSFYCRVASIKRSNDAKTEIKTAIESSIKSNSIVTKETKDYQMEVRNLDDGNKEVYIHLKNSRRENFYFVVYKDGTYTQTNVDNTGFDWQTEFK